MTMHTMHYSDLITYWECPRRWWWEHQGWRPYRLPDAMLRGHLVDQGVAASWRGEDARVAVAMAVHDHILSCEGEHNDTVDIHIATVRDLGKEALDMVARYMQHLGNTITPLLIGTTVTKITEDGAIAGTPDCVALDGNQRVLVELKTGHEPNPQMYSTTGQADYYAYLLGNIDVIYYDLVGEKSILRYQRPPRLDRGAYLARETQTLQAHFAFPGVAKLITLDQPKYTWRCGQCPFLQACQTRDDGGDEEEVLLSTMWRDDANT